MVELLVIAAGRAIFGPILGRVWADVQQAAADKIEGIVKDWWSTRSHPPDSESKTGSESPHQAEEDVPVAASESDGEIAESMDGNTTKADEFRRVLEKILGVELSEAPAGTDDRVLSSYEALMWRAAVMTGWERRPIALAGSLLGPNWVIVCKPTAAFKPGSVVDPSLLWGTNKDGDLVRPTNAPPPVEFYVQQFPDSQDAVSAADTLNQSFINDRNFEAGAPGPLGEAWHRVDGLNRGWVRFQWDDVVAKNARSMRPSYLAGYAGDIGLSNDEEFRLRPIAFREFPDSWRTAMTITNPTEAIETLRKALDAYASVSAESLAAARAALSKR